MPVSSIILVIVLPGPLQLLSNNQGALAITKNQLSIIIFSHWDNLTSCFRSRFPHIFSCNLLALSIKFSFLRFSPGTSLLGFRSYGFSASTFSLWVFRFIVFLPHALSFFLLGVFFHGPLEVFVCFSLYFLSNPSIYALPSYCSRSRS